MKLEIIRLLYNVPITWMISVTDVVGGVIVPMTHSSIVTMKPVLTVLVG